MKIRLSKNGKRIGRPPGSKNRPKSPKSYHVARIKVVRPAPIKREPYEVFAENLGRSFARGFMAGVRP